MSFYTFNWSHRGLAGSITLQVCSFNVSKRITNLKSFENCETYNKCYVKFQGFSILVYQSYLRVNFLFYTNNFKNVIQLKNNYYDLSVLSDSAKISYRSARKYTFTTFYLEI